MLLITKTYLLLCETDAHTHIDCVGSPTGMRCSMSSVFLHFSSFSSEDIITSHLCPDPISEANAIPAQTEFCFHILLEAARISSLAIRLIIIFSRIASRQKENKLAQTAEQTQKINAKFSADYALPVYLQTRHFWRRCFCCCSLENAKRSERSVSLLR